MTTPDINSALASTDVIDAGHPAVRRAASSLVAARSEPADKVAALFEWVRDEIAYDMAPDLTGRLSWRASDTLERGWGFCQQKAVLLTAMARSVGVPAVLAFQSVIEHRLPDRFEVYLPDKRMRPHGLTAVWIDGRWQRLDASLHTGMCDRRGLRVVEWSPGSDALLPRFDLAGDRHCTVEEELGLYADLPDHIYAETMSLDFLHTAEFKAAVRRQGRNEATTVE